MATEKSFALIGEFKDNITPKLKKLNSEISTISKSFSKMQSRLRPIARDMGTIAMASERVSGALKGQRGAYETNIRAMRAYRSEMGKTVNAAQRLSRIRPPKPVQPTRGRPTSHYSESVGGGRFRQVRGDGDGGKGGLGFLGTTGAVALGNILTQSIISGFHTGVNLMMKPLQYFGNAFAERVGDEMADIQSAGGMFALDKGKGTGLFQGFEDALSMQERLNQSLAKSAAALPGATNDYVRTARQITDTVMIAYGKSQEDFKTLATELGASVSASSEEQITKVLSTFTEKGVLLGQGQSGGIPLPVLLEQLVSKEQVSASALKTKYVALRDNPLLANAIEEAQAEINKTGAGTAKRIGMVIKTLEKALPQEVINKMRGSIAGLQESYRSAFFDPDTGLFGLSRELSVKAPVLDQFGRQMYELSQDVEVGGKTLKKGSKIVAEQLKGSWKSLSEVAVVATESTSVFKTLRETLAFFLVPLSELLDVLPTLFDPLGGIAEAFQGLRERGAELFKAFNEISQYVVDEADSYAKNIEARIAAGTLTGKEAIAKEKGIAERIRREARSRGSIGAFTEMLEAMGALDKKAATEIYDQVNDVTKEFNLGRIVPKILNSLINSNLVTKEIPEAIGKAVGSFFEALGGLVVGVAQSAQKGNPLAKAIDSFFKGLNSAFGKTPEEAEKRKSQIIGSISEILGKAVSMFGAALATIGVPLVIGALKSFVSALWEEGGMAGKVIVVVGALKLFTTAIGIATAAQLAQAKALGGLSFLKGGLAGLLGKAGPQATGAAAKGMMAGGAVRSAPGSLLKLLTTPPPGAVKGLLQGKSGFMSFLGGAGSKNFVAGLKAFGAKLPLIGGLITTIMSLFEGKSILDAISAGLGSAGGSAIGAAIGTIIFPGIGTALGAAIGGWIGTLEPVTNVMKGVLTGIGEVFGAIGDTLGPVLGSLITAFGDLFQVGLSIVSMLNPFAVSLGESTKGIDLLKAAVVAVKVILWPIVGAFQLLEQVLNLVVLTFKGLKVAVLGARLGLSKMNPFANKEAQNALEKEFVNAVKEAEKAQGSFQLSWERHSKYYTTNLDKSSESLKSLQSAAEKTSSTFENNKMFEEAGKKWGWAMKNGEKVMVEWGSVAGTALKEITTKTETEQVVQAKVTETLSVETADWFKEIQDNLSKGWEDFKTSSSKSLEDLKSSLQKGWEDLNAFIKTIPEGVSFGIRFAVGMLERGFVSLYNFLTVTLPSLLGTAVATLIAGAKAAWASLTLFLSSLPGLLSAAISGLMGWLASLPGKVSSLVSNFVNAAAGWASSVSNALMGVGDAIKNWAAGLWGRVSSAFTQGREAGRAAASSGKTGAGFMGTGAEKMLPSFGAALQAEQRGMPAGAKPIIANDSELIIPTENALNGNGSVAEIIAPLLGIEKILSASFSADGLHFATVFSLNGKQIEGISALRSESAKYSGIQSGIGKQQISGLSDIKAENAAANAKLANLQSQQQQTNAKLTELKAKMNAPLGSFAGIGMAGGPGYGAKGSAIAGALGNFIKQTGGAPGSIHEHPQHGGVKYRHAPGSYHYSGRAIDIGAYAHEQGGVLKRVAAFNQQFGVRPVELLHAGNDPNHQDHVHVAYARGVGMPRFFGSFMDALSYERHMMPSGTKAVYNTGETGGSSPTVNITVNASGGDPNAIANQVAAAVLNAIRQAETSTIS